MTKINPESSFAPTTDRIEGELALVGGITIRAEFAARFMVAMITLCQNLPPEQLVESAISAADALIAELNKPTL